MGRPKHLLEIGGRSFLQWCLDALNRVVDEVIVSVGTGQELPALSSNVVIVEDLYPHRGPMSGLASTLTFTGAQYSVVLSCDAPLIKPDILTLLFKSVGSSDAALPTASGKPQYFPGVYSSRVGGVAKRLLEVGEHRISALIAECDCCLVSESQVLEVDPKLESFLNINTPHDFEAISALAGGD